MSLSSDEKMDLKRLLKSNTCHDNTDYIRQFKHSSKIRKDIHSFISLKQEFCSTLPKDLSLYNSEESKRLHDSFLVVTETKCSFLFNNYPEIYKKIVQDELDITLFFSLLDVLKQIEDNKTDQHEGSVKVGKLLKEIYIDSAVRHGNHLDELNTDKSITRNEIIQPISWATYKKSFLTNSL